MSVRKGHTLLANLVISGEVPLALNVYQYKAAQLKNDGAPIDWFVIPPSIARFQGAGVSSRAPHPHAAVLLFDFLLSDAQQLPMRRDYSPSTNRAKSQEGELPIRVIDPAEMLDEGDKWSKRYKDLVVSKPR
jgi:iron(III) transport system substrate-binding protein